MSKRKRTKKFKGIVTVVGLGYVGLPLACLCAENGYQTYGVARNRKNIGMINRGDNPLADDPTINEIISKKIIQAAGDYKSVLKSDIVVICVPTPVDEFFNPDLRPIKDVSKKISKNLKKGKLVILESTVNPGICEEIVRPILESGSGLRAGRDFYLAHCPERINPGDAKWNVHNIPRVVGALTKKGLRKAIHFYKTIINAEIVGVQSIKEAEATKIVENSFRDINIAFVNELAKSFDQLGIDISEVLKGAATKPFAFMPHMPGVGVGGHCIPVDPYFMIERAKQSGFDHKFLKLARDINNSMPKYTVDLLVRQLNHLGLSLKKTRVGILGVSYKANIGDLRESPSLKVIKLLNDMEAEVEIFDPLVPEYSSVKSLDDLLRKTQALILAVNHDEFVNLDIKKLKRFGIKIVIDGKNCLNKQAVKQIGVMYKGIGR